MSKTKLLKNSVGPIAQVWLILRGDIKARAYIFRYANILLSFNGTGPQFPKLQIRVRVLAGVPIWASSP